MDDLEAGCCGGRVKSRCAGANNRLSHEASPRRPVRWLMELSRVPVRAVVYHAACDWVNALDCPWWCPLRGSGFSNAVVSEHPRDRSLNCAAAEDRARSWLTSTAGSGPRLSMFIWPGLRNRITPPGDPAWRDVAHLAPEAVMPPPFEAPARSAGFPPPLLRLAPAASRSSLTVSRFVDGLVGSPEPHEQ